MAKTLAETQQQMWKHWCDLMPGISSPMPLYSGPASQGNEEAAEGFKAWTAESAQVVKDVADRLLTTQQELLRFLELSLRAWK
ncbi:MAG: poly(R)-hydroxyalkanoic acid synthase subunit PhaE, partial [Terriglobia bacterium]